MPAFNAEKTLEAAVLSVAEQSGAIDCELLVIDDASVDRTLAIARDLARRWRWIRVLPNRRRKGPSGARNTGLIEATGEYVAFLDADDAWLPNHLALALAAFTGSLEMDVLTFDCQVVDRDSGVTQGTWFSMRKFPRCFQAPNRVGGICEIKALVAPALVEESFLHLQATVIRKSSFEGLLFREDICRSEDRDYFFRAFQQRPLRLGYSDVVTGVYYRTAGTLTAPTAQNAINAVNDQVRVLEGYLAGGGLDAMLHNKIIASLYDRLLVLSYQHRQQSQYGQSLRCLRSAMRYRWDARWLHEMLKTSIMAVSAFLTPSRSE